ncbi:MAG: endonuclease MutS2 [Melioribacteraceae bacterium]|nr:endonuclease MutS2 [Melioribacteraceae bacterium]
MIDKAILEKLEFYKVLSYISKYAVTEIGKSIIENLSPLNDIDGILRAGNYINEAKEILIEEDYPPISYIPDLYKFLSQSKIENTVLPKNKILEIKKLAETSRLLHNYLMKFDKSDTLKNNLASNLFVDKQFEQVIKKVFTESGDISDNASQKLKEIRRDIRNKNENINKVITRILKELSSSYIVQDEYVTQRDGRMVMPVKAEHKRHVKGFIHSESATGQTVYIEPEETLELNNEILSLNFAEKREIERILGELTRHIGNASFELQQSLKLISEIDAIFAKAKYSMEILGSFPSIEKDKSFKLLNARHPILIKKLSRNKTVPLDIEIGSENVILITGPNAGGKTVVLKTVALLSCMIQAGIHIPANPDSNLHLFSKILVDIGDEQSIEDDLSTFSSHLTNIKEILKKADEETLVLIDEIGTGTDPYEGSALASATLIALNKLNAKVLATTHHGNLKMLANDQEGFQNASMEFDLDNLVPTYLFKQGIPGSSYAFEVAKRIGFDEKFINLAKENLDQDKTKVEEFLVELENNSKRLQKKLNKLEIENARLKGLTKLYEDKVAKLDNKKAEIIKNAKSEAENYLSDVNKRVEQAIKNIRESNAEKETIKKEKSDIEKLKLKTRKVTFKEVSEPIKKDHKFKVGDYAQVEGTSTSGEILEINLSRNKAVISSGSIKLQVKLSKLLPAKKQNINNSRSMGIQFISSLPSSRLDIRGMRPEEAEFEIIKFLDDAYTSDINSVEILHGKGTGVLKMLVKEILEQNDYVKNYYYAKIEMGGEGVTIVEL